MELAQINQRIAVVNAESKRLNNERQVNIGKRETLEKQLNDAIALYKKTYGVDISVDTLDAEMQRVTSEKEKEVSHIEAVLSCIKEGRFDEVQKMVSQNNSDTTVISSTTPAQSEVSTAPVVAPTAPVVEPTVAPTAPVVEPTASVVEPTVVLTAPVVEPTVPVAPPVFETSNIPAPVATPALESPVAPPVMPTPVVAEPVAPTIPSGVQNVGVIPNIGATVPTAPSTPSLSGLDMDIPTPPAPPVSNPSGIGGVTPPVGNGVKATNFNAILGGKAFDPLGTN